MEENLNLWCTISPSREKERHDPKTCLLTTDKDSCTNIHLQLHTWTNIRMWWFLMRIIFILWSDFGDAPLAFSSIRFQKISSVLMCVIIKACATRIANWTIFDPCDAFFCRAFTQELGEGIIGTCNLWLGDLGSFDGWIWHYYRIIVTLRVSI